MTRRISLPNNRKRSSKTSPFGISPGRYNLALHDMFPSFLSFWDRVYTLPTGAIKHLGVRKKAKDLERHLLKQIGGTKSDLRNRVDPNDPDREYLGHMAYSIRQGLVAKTRWGWHDYEMLYHRLYAWMLVELGLSLREIGREMGLHWTTVRKYHRKIQSLLSVIKGARYDRKMKRYWIALRKKVDPAFARSEELRQERMKAFFRPKPELSLTQILAIIEMRC